MILLCAILIIDLNTRPAFILNSINFLDNMEIICCECRIAAVRWLCGHPYSVFRVLYPEFRFIFQFWSWNFRRICRRDVHKCLGTMLSVYQNIFVSFTSKFVGMCVCSFGMDKWNGAVRLRKTEMHNERTRMSCARFYPQRTTTTIYVVACAWSSCLFAYRFEYR